MQIQTFNLKYLYRLILFNTWEKFRPAKWKIIEEKESRFNKLNLPFIEEHLIKQASKDFCVPQLQTPSKPIKNVRYVA